MYDEQIDVATYDGTYGYLRVAFGFHEQHPQDVIDRLDHRGIQRYSSPEAQSRRYGVVGQVLLNDGSNGDAIGWHLDYLPDGSAYFSDGVNYELTIGPNGVKLSMPHSDFVEKEA